LTPHFYYQITPYAEFFMRSVGLCPHSCSDDQLDQAVIEKTGYRGSIRAGDLDRSSALDLLMSEVVEPEITSWCMTHDKALFLT